jgi:hypothetical protein
MPRLRADPWHPVDSQVAAVTAEEEPSEFPLEFGLGPEELHPQSFRRCDWGLDLLASEPNRIVHRNEDLRRDHPI